MNIQNRSFAYRTIGYKYFAQALILVPSLIVFDNYQLLKGNVYRYTYLIFLRFFYFYFLVINIHEYAEVTICISAY